MRREMRGVAAGGPPVKPGIDASLDGDILDVLPTRLFAQR